MTDEVETRSGLKWDFFISHAGADLNVAKTLKQKLDPPAKVFLDKETLLLGDDFDLDLPAAQRASLISVVVVSAKTKEAFYQREEIAAAIEMVRRDKHTHRVVPVYINVKEIPPDGIPLGLRVKHSFYIPESGDYAAAGRLLLETLGEMKRREETKAGLVAEYQQAIPRLTGDDTSASLLGALGAVTRFVRPFLWALVVLFFLVAALLVVCLSLPFFADVRALVVALSGVLLTLIVAGVLLVVAHSFKMAVQIGQGRINGG